jgi:hypothetical protein
MELQTNIFNGYRFKGSQQNTGGDNSATHHKDHRARQNFFHSRDTKIAGHL